MLPEGCKVGKYEMLAMLQNLLLNVRHLFIVMRTLASRGKDLRQKF